MNKIEGLVRFPNTNKKNASRVDINKNKVKNGPGVVPCNENNLIVDGNKINSNTGLSNNAKILYG